MDYDLIVVGAGHNALISAAYAAKAGYRVGVFERRAIVGGAVIPPLYGALADAVGVQSAFLVLTLCYGTIAVYGLSRARATPALIPTTTPT